MRRGWLGIALLVSLGLNIGLVSAVLAGRWAQSREVAESPAVIASGDGTSLETPRWGADGRGRAQGRFHGPPGEPPVGRLADHLGLAGERRERFLGLQRRFVATQLETRRERRAVAADLSRELASAEPDTTRVDRLISRLGEVYLVGERTTAEVILESRGLLDAEQQEVYLRFLRHLRRPGGPSGERPGPPRRP